MWDVLKVRKSSYLFDFFCLGDDGNRHTKSFSCCALELDVLFIEKLSPMLRG